MSGASRNRNEAMRSKLIIALLCIYTSLSGNYVLLEFSLHLGTHTAALKGKTVASAESKPERLQVKTRCTFQLREKNWVTLCVLLRDINMLINTEAGGNMAVDIESKVISQQGNENTNGIYFMQLMSNHDRNIVLLRIRLLVPLHATCPLTDCW